MRAPSALAGFATVAAAGLVAGCASRPAAPNAADRTFLARMIAHHERAIEVARIGETHADDLRVLAFAQRIVDEQLPELEQMQHLAQGLHLDLAAGASSAMHRITDTQVRTLTGKDGAAFDREFVALNVTSEQGADDMAETDLHGGTAPDVRSVAGGIAKSPSEIRELQRLLRDLPAG